MLRSAAVVFLFVATAIPSHAFIAQNSLVVEPIGEGKFEVPYRGLSGTPDFWCAAGDYVVRGLNLPPTTRIYRTSSSPRRSGQGVSFSLSEKGAKTTGLLFYIGGRGLTAGHARHLCEAKQLSRE